MKKKRLKDPVAEVVQLLGRVVDQAALTQFQIMTINRRLDAMEKTALPLRHRKARRTR